MKKIIRAGVITAVLFLILRWIGVNTPEIGFICFLCFIGLTVESNHKPKLTDHQTNQHMQSTTKKIISN